MLIKGKGYLWRQHLPDDDLSDTKRPMNETYLVKSAFGREGSGRRVVTTSHTVVVMRILARNKSDKVEEERAMCVCVAAVQAGDFISTDGHGRSMNLQFVV